MNKKLKQQLKLTYKPPLPKRKEAFFRQIESQIQTKQSFSSRFSFLNAKRAITHFPMRKALREGERNFAHQKWVWATVAMGLLVISLYPKPSTTEYQPKTSHYTSSCVEHIWICVEECSITNTEKYVHYQCINCNKVSMTIENITFCEESIYLSKEDISVSKEAISWQHGITLR